MVGHATNEVGLYLYAYLDSYIQVTNEIAVSFAVK